MWKPLERLLATAAFYVRWRKKHAPTPEDDAELIDQLDDRAMYQEAPESAFPHCDGLILHAPGECGYCDEYPRAQADRLRNHVSFTGASRFGWRICPSEERRHLEKIEKWPGNRARRF